MVTLLGANGAGKTTTLRAISGMVRTQGRITFDGREITNWKPEEVARLGVAHVPSGRGTLAQLTVLENMKMGAYLRRDGAVKQDLARVMAYFPWIADRSRQIAVTLSGGEQQMLAIARALMASPRLLLLDEPSLGLAPLIVQQIRNIVVDINRQGTSVLLVEQNATMALSIAELGYVLETGRVAMGGPAQQLLADRDIQEFYLGVGESGRRSFRDVKTYRRRKRWTA